MRRLAVVALLVSLALASDAAGAAFHARISRIGPAVRAHMSSWHRGCPVPLGSLRLMTLGHWGFDGRVHTGRLVVHADAARAVRHAMHALFDARFPIRRMRLVEDYGADDERSMAADNTSAFNCRRAAGSTSWSEHAFGRAIDINPRENPMILDGRTFPPNARRRGPGVIRAGGVAVRAFAAVGWGWGGRWANPTDYQHFSATGN